MIGRLLFAAGTTTWLTLHVAVAIAALAVGLLLVAYRLDHRAYEGGDE